jgi:hypothetical protein
VTQIVLRDWVERAVVWVMGLGVGGHSPSVLRSDTVIICPWSRALLEPTVPQLVNKFPALYGTPVFVTVFTTARQLSPS